MKEKIESKISDIVDAIIKKDPRAIAKDEYDILAAELRRVIYNEEAKEKNQKLSEAMAAMVGSSFGSTY